MYLSIFFNFLLMAMFVVVPSGLEVEAVSSASVTRLPTWSTCLVSAGYIFSGSGALILECTHWRITIMSLRFALRIGCHVSGRFYWDPSRLCFFTGFTALDIGAFGLHLR